MRLGRSIRILAAGGAVLAPLCAFGHAIEYLTAKLTLLPDAFVRLEITADHASNPLIPDEAAALDALKNPLYLQSGAKWLPLSDLTAPKIEHHKDWSRCAPPNLPPPPPEAEHALITATWQWQHPGDSLIFTVPKGNMHDVFLWQPTQADEGASPRWMVLLAGDVTREIPVLPRRWPFWLLLVIPPALLLLRYLRRNHHANFHAKIPDFDSSQPQGNRHSHVPPNP
jgi:hypothetical protein